MAEILAYSDYRGIRYGEEREEFFHHVQLLDGLFMKEMDARKPKKTK